MKAIDGLKKGLSAEIKGDTSAAINIYKPIAQAGNAWAMGSLANVYNQVGNKHKAAEWYLEALINGYEEVISPLSSLIIWKSDEKIQSLLTNTYLQCDSELQTAVNEQRELLENPMKFANITFAMGVMNAFGWGVPKSKENSKLYFEYAFKFYKELVEQGETHAFCKMGMMTLEGWTPENHSEYESDRKSLENSAFLLFTRASNDGDIVAKSYIGDFFRCGKGKVEQDINKAYAFYKQAADAGYPPAIKALHDLDKAKDDVIALQQHTKNGDLCAKLKLARKYRFGKYVQQNLNEAARLYAEISTVSDISQLTASELDAYGEATYNFANMYFEGVGVNQNYQKARELYSKGASAGFYPSIKSLAEMYKSGQGGRKDSSHADYLLEVNEEFFDAAAGIIEAKYKIAYRFWEGKFVKPNEQKAFALFKEIAESNNICSWDEKYKQNAIKNMALLEKSLGKSDVVVTIKSLSSEKTRAYISSLYKKYGNAKAMYFLEMGDNAKTVKTHSKIKNAIAKYARDAQNEDVIVLHDATIFGDAEKGFLITNKAIYTSFPNGKQGSITHDKIKSVDFVSKGFFSSGHNIFINHEQDNELEIWKNCCDEKIAYELIQEVVNHIKSSNKKNSRKQNIKSQNAQVQKETKNSYNNSPSKNTNSNRNLYENIIGNVIKSPMPGIIKKVYVREGQMVNEGDVLLLLEAMKMLNELTSDSTGKIEGIFVSPGQAVAAGDPLVSIISI